MTTDDVFHIPDDKVKNPHENPYIEIVPCENDSKDFVKYVIQDYAKPIGVATYLLSGICLKNCVRLLKMLNI